MLFWLFLTRKSDNEKQTSNVITLVQCSKPSSKRVKSDRDPDLYSAKFIFTYRLQSTVKTGSKLKTIALSAEIIDVADEPLVR